MNREEAFEALELLRRVVRETRDDTVLQNWGLIWMVHACTNAAGFFATGWLLARGVLTPLPFVGLWSAIIGGNLLTVALLRRRRAGARSFVRRPPRDLLIEDQQTTWIGAAQRQHLGLSGAEFFERR